MRRPAIPAFLATIVFILSAGFHSTAPLAEQRQAAAAVQGASGARGYDARLPPRRSALVKGFLGLASPGMAHHPAPPRLEVERESR